MSENSKDKSVYLNAEQEAKHNWLGFWSLLLEIDKRNNPEKYRRPAKDHD